MANTFSPIRFIVFDQVFPNNGKLPVVSVPSDGMAFGSIEIEIDNMGTPTVAGSVYAVSPPTTSEDRYLRIGADLYTQEDPCLVMQTTQLSTGRWKIAWQFDPAEIPAAHGDYYSVEISATDSTIWVMPKLIVAVQNQIDTVTGAA
jgi:hypothetical protein